MYKVTKNREEALAIYKKRREEIIQHLDPEKITPFFMLIELEDKIQQTIITNPDTWFGAVCKILNGTYKQTCAIKDHLDKMIEDSPSGRFNSGEN